MVVSISNHYNQILLTPLNFSAPPNYQDDQDDQNYQDTQDDQYDQDNQHDHNDQGDQNYQEVQVDQMMSNHCKSYKVMSDLIK